MRGLPFDENSSGRPTCYTCFRPLTHCLCGTITPFTAHCNFLILQHPNERHKHYSTVRLVKRSIRNARILRGVVFPEQELQQELGDQQAYVLYPGAQSIDCRDVQLGSDSTIIVLDGTWDEAGKIMYRNPLLRSLPRISFAAALESNYHIRRQPAPGCLSTIESIAHLLMMNARAAGQDARAESYQVLFEVFDRLVERQLSYFPRMQRGRIST